MTKGYNAYKERQETLSSYGKGIGKRAGFACEWCGDKEDLRVLDQKPDREPEMESLALLCGRCRSLAEGRKADLNELRAIRNALWSDIPAVAEGAAQVLARCKEPWIREAIEESLIDEDLKTELLR